MLLGITVAQDPRPDTSIIGRKVRSGCGTCKLRRVKCDETRPVCNRCFSSDRVCSGYRGFARRKKRTIDPQRPSSDDLVIGHNLNFADTTAGSTYERHFFDFFRTQTLPVIDDGFRSSFWDQLVFQISAVNPAVRSAVVALAACHEEQNQEAHCFAASTKYYVDSLRNLQEHVSTGRQDHIVYVLCCCLIFTAFEIVRGNGSAASLHLRNGLRIIAQQDREHKRRLESPAKIISEDLIPVFVRMNIQARANFRPPDRGSALNLPLPYPPDIPATFRDLTQARDILSILYEKGFSLFQAVATANVTGDAYHYSSGSELDPDLGSTNAPVEKASPDPQLLIRKKISLINKLTQLRSNLTRWTTAFEDTLIALRARSPNFELVDSDLCSSLTIRIHLIVAQIILATCTSASSKAFDAHTKAFRDLVGHAKKLFANPSWIHNNGSNYSKGSFSLDLGVVNPLRWVITTCRHPQVRRDALNLLQSLGDRREGSWDAVTAAKSAEWAIAIEEGRIKVESGVWYTDVGQVWRGEAEVSPIEPRSLVDQSRVEVGGNEFVGLGIEEKDVDEHLQRKIVVDGEKEDPQAMDPQSAKKVKERQKDIGEDDIKVVRRIRRLHTEIDKEKGRIRLVPVFELEP